MNHFFRRRIALLSFCALSWMVVWPGASAADEAADTGRFSLRLYTERDGLVSAEVIGTYRDSRGFLWVSTFDGLSRFDGRDFQSFSRVNGLLEGYADVLGEDNAGRVYIQSLTHVYHYTGDALRPFVAVDSGEAGRIVYSAVPRAAGGVWAVRQGDSGIHLFMLDGRDKFLPTSTPVIMLGSDATRTVYALQQNGTISIVGDDRLLVVHRIAPTGTFSGDGMQLSRDASGRVWSYAANNRCIHRYDGASIADSIPLPVGTPWWCWWVGGAKEVFLTLRNGEVSQLEAGRWIPILSPAQVRGVVYGIAQQPGGTLWISTVNGLIRADRKRYRSVVPDAPLSYFTADTHGRSILRVDSGLYRIRGAVQAFATLRPQMVMQVYLTRSGSVYFSTETGAYVLAPGRQLRRLATGGTYGGKDAGFRFRRVTEDRRGGLWISSYHGVFYAGPDGALRYFFDRDGLNEGAQYTTAITERGAFLTAGVRVFAFDGMRFRSISEELHLAHDISRLATDQQDRVWVSQNTDKIIRIAARADGSYYAADSLRLAANGHAFTAASMCFDDAGNLWICDNRSLYCYRNSPRGYAAGEPLVWNENLSGSPLLYPGGGDAVQVLSHPLAGNYLRSYSATVTLANTAAVAPRVLLTGIRLFKKDFPWARNGFTTDALGIPYQPELRHDQNFLQFSFSAITPDLADNVVYRYRLEGLANGWSPVTEVGSAEYTALRAGRYMLVVQARTTGTPWSVPLRYAFSISPVWWARWWAVALWVGLGCAVVAGVVRLRWRAVARRAEVRKLLAEEKLKALRAQINPHFLQNTFSFLAHTVSASSTPGAVKTIDRLSAYLRKILYFSERNSVSLEDELEFSEEYLRLQQDIIPTPFSYRFHIGESVDIFDTRVPSMLLQPIIENSLKYGLDPRGENRVSIRVCAEHPYLRITIRDTGNRSASVLRPAAKSAFGSGKGLALTGERLTLFYADFEHTPQLLREANARGGCDVHLLVPTL